MSYQKEILLTGAGSFIGHRLISRTKRKGVCGRNSHNERLKQVLGQEPSIPFEVGLNTMYKWIDSESAGSLAGQFSCSQD